MKFEYIYVTKQELVINIQIPKSFVDKKIILKSELA